MLYSEIKALKPKCFQRLTGVKPVVFEQLVSMLRHPKALRRKHPRRGRPCKLTVADEVLMLLMYYREYRSFLHIAITYGIRGAHCRRIITQSEQLLLAKLADHPVCFEVVLLDVGESPIERPKKQRRYYSGKKKRPTLKTQLLVCRHSKEVICIRVDKGRKHDVRVFKESALPLQPDLIVQGDSGYQGLQKLHAASELPYKATRKKPLAKEQKQHNHTLASRRVRVEHVIRKLKVFKLLSLSKQKKKGCSQNQPHCRYLQSSIKNLIYVRGLIKLKNRSY